MERRPTEPCWRGAAEDLAAEHASQPSDPLLVGRPHTLKHRESDTKVRRTGVRKQGSKLVRSAAIEAVSKTHSRRRWAEGPGAGLTTEKPGSLPATPPLTGSALFRDAVTGRLCSHLWRTTTIDRVGCSRTVFGRRLQEMPRGSRRRGCTALRPRLRRAAGLFYHAASAAIEDRGRCILDEFAPISDAAGPELSEQLGRRGSLAPS